MNFWEKLEKGFNDTVSNVGKFVQSAVKSPIVQAAAELIPGAKPVMDIVGKAFDSPTPEAPNAGTGWKEQYRSATEMLRNSGQRG